MTAYIERWHIKADSLRRNPEGTSHSGSQRFTARAHDPWIVNSTTRYPHQIGARPDKPPLKSGFNNTKIGKKVLKGRWAGMPIWTLTLTERATCGPCAHKMDCYGNASLNAHRQQHGEKLNARIFAQLKDLQRDHPDGFVVRLHVLGDFYSVEYVRFWQLMLNRITALRIYGYTARDPKKLIGDSILRMMQAYPSRVAMRWSDYEWDDLPRTVSIKSAEDCPADSFVCPAQTQKTACCSTCAACWDSTKRVAFLNH